MEEKKSGKSGTNQSPPQWLPWACSFCRQPAGYCWEITGRELSLYQACYKQHKTQSFAQLWQDIHVGKRVTHPWERWAHGDCIPLRWFEEEEA